MADLYAAGPQSGGRPPAPGRLALVQAFVNSFYDLAERRGTDQFATPAGLAGWLEGRGLGAGSVTAAELRRAVAVREGLRAVLLEHNGIPRDTDALAALRDAADGLPVTMAIDADGETEPVAAGSGVGPALGLVMAIVHEARADGTWERLKACPGHHCGWAFYDQSLSRTSRWCSMRVCGGREKARAYRRRTRREPIG
jgi:predicted RNA-binding Zn ribbon-like protein